MKKTLLLVLIAMLGCMLMLAACNEQASVPTPDETPSGTETPDDPDTPDKQPHVHAFGEWITLSEPTCIAEGVEARVCACGEQETQETAARGHTEVVDKAVVPTSFTEGLTEGSHCSVCGVVLVEQQRIDVVPPVDVEFKPFGTITTEETVIETNHLRLNIPANVYISSDLVENLNLITSIMEEVSGMKFEGNPRYGLDLMNVSVVKLKDTESEMGPAYGGVDGATISSGDIMNGELWVLIHESSHALKARQSQWFYCQWAEESISIYTTYKVQSYIAEHHPELLLTVGPVNITFNNYGLYNYKELYQHPVEYWMENEFHSQNANYPIGFAFAWYLDEVYGDYTKWITVYEEMNPFSWENVSSNNLSIEEQIKAYKAAYGDDVFDGFYPWLKKNENIFDNRPSDVRAVEKIQLYPRFTASQIDYFMPGVWSGGADLLYHDLYIDLSAGKQYLTEYKGRNIDGMQLKINYGVVVELYDEQGRLMRVAQREGDSGISLDGVSFIKLVGNGKITLFEINGFDCEYH